jgi:uncharacterized protein HemY
LVVSEKALGPEHPDTRKASTTLRASFRSRATTADALDALGRTEEAKALRERYGLAGPDK